MKSISNNKIDPWFYYSAPINILPLKRKTFNTLAKAKIKKMRHLLSYTEYELLGFKNFGSATLSEIKLKLSDIGLSLGLFKRCYKCGSIDERMNKGDR